VRLQEEGVVELEFRIRENGSVRGVSITSSSGFDRLDAAALAAAQTWRFNPTTGGGDLEIVRYRLQFRLVDE
jgi:protein TonB